MSSNRGEDFMTMFHLLISWVSDHCEFHGSLTGVPRYHSALLSIHRPVLGHAHASTLAFCLSFSTSLISYSFIAVFFSLLICFFSLSFLSFSWLCLCLVSSFFITSYCFTFSSDSCLFSPFFFLFLSLFPPCLVSSISCFIWFLFLVTCLVSHISFSYS